MSKRMYHPCHKLSVPSAKLFWCRHCMQMFEDAITRWKHSKQCRGNLGFKPKDQDGQVIQMYVKPDKVSYTTNKLPGQNVVHKAQVKKTSADLKCVICLAKFTSLDDMREHVKFPCNRYKFQPIDSEESDTEAVEDSAATIKIRRVESSENELGPNTSTALAVLAEASKHVESLAHRGSFVNPGDIIKGEGSVEVTPSYPQYQTLEDLTSQVVHQQELVITSRRPFIRQDLDPVVVSIQAEDGQDIPEATLDAHVIQSCVKETVEALPLGQVVQVEINNVNKQVCFFAVGCNGTIHQVEESDIKPSLQEVGTAPAIQPWAGKLNIKNDPEAQLTIQNHQDTDLVEVLCGNFEIPHSDGYTTSVGNQEFQAKESHFGVGDLVVEEVFSDDNKSLGEVRNRTKFEHSYQINQVELQTPEAEQNKIQVASRVNPAQQRTFQESGTHPPLPPVIVQPPGEISQGSLGSLSSIVPASGQQQGLNLQLEIDINLKIPSTLPAEAVNRIQASAVNADLGDIQVVEISGSTPTAVTTEPVAIDNTAELLNNLVYPYTQNVRKTFDVMASGEQLASMEDWFGFAELADEPSTSKPASIQPSSSHKPDNKPTQGQSCEKTKNVIDTADHRNDQNEVIVPIISTKSGVKKYKVLARQKVEDDDNVDEIVKKEEESDDDSPPITSLKYVGNNTWRGTYNRYSKNVISASSVRYCPDSGKVEIRPESVKEKEESKARSNDKIKSEKKKSKKKKSDDKETHGKKKKRVKKSEKVKACDEEKCSTDIQEAQNALDETKKDHSEKEKVELDRSETLDTSRNKTLEDSDRNTSPEESDKNITLEEPDRNKTLEETDRNKIPEESDRNKTLEEPDAAESNAPAELVSVAAEVNEEVRDNKMQESEMSESSGTKCESNCDKMETSVSDSTKIVVSDKMETSVNPCSVKLKRDPSIESLHAFIDEKCRNEDKAASLRGQDIAGEEKQHQLVIDNEAGMDTSIPRRHSADDKDEQGKPVERQVSMDELRIKKSPMVYNPELELRKSGRLKAASCSSRYRGDYGIRVETYSKLINTTGKSNGEESVTDSEKEDDASQDSCNECEKQAMDTDIGEVDMKRKISFKDSSVRKKKLKIVKKIKRPRRPLKGVHKSNHSSNAGSCETNTHTQSETDIQVSFEPCSNRDLPESFNQSEFQRHDLNDSEMMEYGSCPSKSSKTCSSEHCTCKEGEVERLDLTSVDRILDHETAVLAQQIQNCSCDLESKPQAETCETCFNEEDEREQNRIPQESVCSTSTCECTCNHTSEITQSCRTHSLVSEDKQICDNQEIVPCSAERKHFCDKISYESVSDSKVAESALNISKEVFQESETVVQMETDDDCVEQLEQSPMKKLQHADYVHSVGKSVNKKQNQVSERKCLQADVEKATQNEIDSSPDSSPTKDPVTILEDLRMKLFEKAGASVKVSNKPKRFESKMISSKRKGSLGTVNPSSGTDASSEVIERECPATVSSSNRSGRSTPKLDTPNLLADSGKEILKEVARTLDIIQQAKRKAEETNNAKAVKPKRQRFQDKKFLLRSMLKKTGQAESSTQKNPELPETIASVLQNEINSDKAYSLSASGKEKAFEAVLEDNMDLDSVDKTDNKDHRDKINLNEEEGSSNVHNEKASKASEKDKKTKNETHSQVPQRKKAKPVKCQVCNLTFKSKDLLRKHYPCRIRQTRTWSQNILRPNRPFRRNDKKDEKKFRCKLPNKNMKADGKSRPQLLTTRKTRFRRVKGKRRRKLHQLINELRDKRKIVHWPHLSVCYERLSYKEQCMYKIGLTCTGKPTEGLGNYTKEELSVFEAHRHRQIDTSNEPFQPYPCDEDIDETSDDGNAKDSPVSGNLSKDEVTDTKDSIETKTKHKVEICSKSDIEQNATDEVSSQLESSIIDTSLCTDTQEEEDTTNISEGDTGKHDRDHVIHPVSFQPILIPDEEDSLEADGAIISEEVEMNEIEETSPTCAVKISEEINISEKEEGEFEREEISSKPSVEIVIESIPDESCEEQEACNSTEGQLKTAGTSGMIQLIEAYDSDTPSDSQLDSIENDGIKDTVTTLQTGNDVTHASESECVQTDSSPLIDHSEAMIEHSLNTPADIEVPSSDIMDVVIAAIDDIISEIVRSKEGGFDSQLICQSPVLNLAFRENSLSSTEDKNARYTMPPDDATSFRSEHTSINDIKADQEYSMNVTEITAMEDVKQNASEAENGEDLSTGPDVPVNLNITEQTQDESFPGNSYSLEPREFQHASEDLTKESYESIESLTSESKNNFPSPNTIVGVVSHEETVMTYDNEITEQVTATRISENINEVSHTEVTEDDELLADTETVCQTGREEFNSSDDHIPVESPSFPVSDSKQNMETADLSNTLYPCQEYPDTVADIDEDDILEVEEPESCLDKRPDSPSDDQIADVSADETIPQTVTEIPEIQETFPSEGLVEENTKTPETGADNEVPFSTSSPCRLETSLSSETKDSITSPQGESPVKDSSSANTSNSETGDESRVVICYEQNGVVISENLLTGVKSIVRKKEISESINSIESECLSSSQETEKDSSNFCDTDSKISIETSDDSFSKKSSDLNVDVDSMSSSPRKSYEAQQDTCDSDTGEDICYDREADSRENKTAVIHFEENGAFFCEDLLTGEKMVVKSKQDESGSTDENCEILIEENDAVGSESNHQTASEDNLKRNLSEEDNFTFRKSNDTLPENTEDDCSKVQENLSKVKINQSIEGEFDITAQLEVTHSCSSSKIGTDNIDENVSENDTSDLAGTSMDISETEKINEDYTSQPEDADIQNGEKVVLRENKDIYNVVSPVASKESQENLNNSAINIALDDETEIADSSMQNENERKKIVMERQKEKNFDLKGSSPIEFEDENLDTTLTDKNVSKLSFHCHNSDIEEMRTSSDTSLVTEHKDFSVLDISIPDDRSSVHSCDKTSPNSEIDSFQKTSDEDKKLPSIADLGSPPPVLEKVEEMGFAMEEQEETLFSDDSDLSSSDPPTLIPEDTTTDAVESSDEVPIIKAVDVETEKINAESDMKKPRTERHFLDVLGDVCQNNDIAGNSSEKDSLKATFDKPSEGEDFLGRHFSDVIDNSVKRYRRQQLTSSQDFEDCGKRKVTIAKLRKILKPTHRKEGFYTTESLLKLRSDIAHLFKKVKIPVKKDPAWLKRDFLKVYGRKKRRSLKHKSNNNVLDSEKYRVNEEDEFFSEEREQSESCEDFADDESEFSDWDEDVSNNESRNLVEKAGSQELDPNVQLMKGGITDNILQMLTSLEDKGNVAVNLSNLLDVLAKNLGLSSSTGEGTTRRSNEVSSDSDSDYSYTDTGVPEPNDMDRETLGERFLESFDGDEPPAIEDIPLPEEDSVISVPDQHEQAQQIQEESWPYCQKSSGDTISDIHISHSTAGDQEDHARDSNDEKKKNNEMEISTHSGTEMKLHSIGAELEVQQIYNRANDISKGQSAESYEKKHASSFVDLTEENENESIVGNNASMISPNLSQDFEAASNVTSDFNTSDSDREKSVNDKSGKATKETYIFKSITELNSIETDDDSNSEGSFNAMSMSERLNELKALSGHVSDTDVKSDISTISDDEELPAQNISDQKQEPPVDRKYTGPERKTVMSGNFSDTDVKSNISDDEELPEQHVSHQKEDLPVGMKDTGSEGKTALSGHVSDSDVASDISNISDDEESLGQNLIHQKEDTPVDMEDTGSERKTALPGHVSDTDLKSDISNISDDDELPRNILSDQEEDPTIGMENTGSERKTDPSKPHSCDVDEGIILKNSAQSVDDYVKSKPLDEINNVTNTVCASHDNSEDNVCTEPRFVEETNQNLAHVECSPPESDKDEDDIILSENDPAEETEISKKKNNDLSTVPEDETEANFSKVMQDISALGESMNKKHDTVAEESTDAAESLDNMSDNQNEYISDQDIFDANENSVADSPISTTDNHDKDFDMPTKKKVIVTTELNSSAAITLSNEHITQTENENSECHKTENSCVENSKSPISIQETCEQENVNGAEIHIPLSEEEPKHKAEKGQSDDLDKAQDAGISLPSENEYLIVENVEENKSEKIPIVGSPEVDQSEDNVHNDIKLANNATISVEKQPAICRRSEENEIIQIKDAQDMLDANRESSKVDNTSLLEVRSPLISQELSDSADSDNAQSDNTDSDNYLSEDEKSDHGAEETHLTAVDPSIKESENSISVEAPTESLECENYIIQLNSPHSPQESEDREDAIKYKDIDNVVEVEVSTCVESDHDGSADESESAAEPETKDGQSVCSLTDVESECTDTESISNENKSESLEITNNDFEGNESVTSDVENSKQPSIPVEKKDQKLLKDEEVVNAVHPEDLSVECTQLVETEALNKEISEGEMSDIANITSEDEESDTTVEYDGPETGQDTFTENELNGTNDDTGLQTDQQDLSSVLSEKADDHSEKENYPMQDISDISDEMHEELSGSPRVYFETIAEKVKRMQKERLLRQSRPVQNRAFPISKPEKAMKEISVFRKSMMDKRIRQTSLSALKIKHPLKKKRKRCNSLPEALKIVSIVRNVSGDIKPCCVKLTKLSQSTIQKYMYPPKSVDRPPIKLRIKLCDIIMPHSPYSTFAESSTEDEITEEPATRSPIYTNIVEKENSSSNGSSKEKQHSSTNSSSKEKQNSSTNSSSKEKQNSSTTGSSKAKQNSSTYSSSKEKQNTSSNGSSKEKQNSSSKEKENSSTTGSSKEKQNSSTNGSSKEKENSSTNGSSKEKQNSSTLTKGSSKEKQNSSTKGSSKEKQNSSTKGSSKEKQNSNTKGSSKEKQNSNSKEKQNSSSNGSSKEKQNSSTKGSSKEKQNSSTKGSSKEKQNSSTRTKDSSKEDKQDSKTNDTEPTYRSKSVDNILHRLKPLKITLTDVMKMPKSRSCDFKEVLHSPCTDKPLKCKDNVSIARNICHKDLQLSDSDSDSDTDLWGGSPKVFASSDEAFQQEKPNKETVTKTEASGLSCWTDITFQESQTKDLPPKVYESILADLGEEEETSLFEEDQTNTISDNKTEGFVGEVTEQVEKLLDSELDKTGAVEESDQDSPGSSNCENKQEDIGLKQMETDEAVMQIKNETFKDKIEIPLESGASEMYHYAEEISDNVEVCEAVQALESVELGQMTATSNMTVVDHKNVQEKVPAYIKSDYVASEMVYCEQMNSFHTEEPSELSSRQSELDVPIPNKYLYGINEESQSSAESSAELIEEQVIEEMVTEMAVEDELVPITSYEPDNPTAQVVVNTSFSNLLPTYNPNANVNGDGANENL